MVESKLHERVVVITGVSRRAGIVNAINPGPVDTGWASAEQRERLRSAFPAGHWSTPDDVAAVLAWLVSAQSAPVTGQVIDAESGFRRRPSG